MIRGKKVPENVFSKTAAPMLPFGNIVAGSNWGEPLKKTMIIILLLVFGLALPAYGYWHSTLHGSAMLSLDFPSQDSRYLSRARIMFYDANKKLLATGQRDEKTNLVWPVHPKVGTCHIPTGNGLLSALKKKKWDKCHSQLTKWITGWASRVRQAQVIHANCYSRKFPVTISRSNSPLEWFIWWIPMPHGYEPPYSSYHANITLRPANCISQ